ncbi:DoxX family protein [Streptomyces sp. Q6]|uniref:DoxX family protein n=1 Tax=Streptomyces citrinus TaxID=3118173 RepID=A0ACD5AM45_9ACTN
MTVTSPQPRRLLGLAPADRLRPYAPTVLRTFAGLIMLVHGLDKLVHGPAGFGDFLRSLGVPAPSLMGWGVSIGETLAGLLLLAGLLTRLTSVVLAVHLTVAMTLVNADTGFMTPQQGTASGAGLEFPLLLVALLIGLLITGPGPLALDRALGIEGVPGAPGAATTAPRRPRPAASTPSAARATSAVRAPSAVRASAISGVIGGAIGAVMSALANYLVVGLPSSAGANAANHAVSGLISGFLAGFLGLLMHRRKYDDRSESPVAGPAVSETR